ncbi:MAG: undecaprenyl-diphosphate phosphatase [Candidatus Eremiobacteraeota bacterium]|nr:undecaprenyl-diphosphate phosphatase [Candidatus Eremiobacteraeota bacterium]
MWPLWAQALVLGLIQGVTEFLPISSSAHLILLPKWTGWPHLGRHFDIALHLGTLLAIWAYFEEDVKRLFRWGRLTWQVALASLPPAVVGLLCGDWLEKHLNNVPCIALCLGVFGLLLGWADRRARLRREVQDLRSWEALALGFAQAVALIPGVSRCGATLTVALLLGLTRREAARITFLTALPVTAGALLLKTLKLGSPLPQDLWTPTLLGIATAALSGWLCIGWLVRYLKNHGLGGFVVYRVALGLLLFALG